MRLNFKEQFARVGNVEIGAVSKVTELDSGLIVGQDKYTTLKDGSMDAVISQLSLVSIEKKLAIIVPCKNEELSLLTGVLHGIPHHCLIILVSNSDLNNFDVERKMMVDFCTTAQRHGIAVHQKNTGLAHAFVNAGMPHIIAQAEKGSDDNAGDIAIRNGKGEGMMIGTVLAKLARKEFVGFIDADNFVPGAVHEYCKIFAAGLNHALHDPSSTSPASEQPLAMVRLKWKSKPKIVDGKLIPQESGRCSRTVNKWMNRLLSSVTSDENHHDFIQTANAGEHAMSIDLALQLQFATGYAVEPFQLIDLWERSTISPPTTPEQTSRLDGSECMRSDSVLTHKKVKILQVETTNPHIHDFSKGEEHIQKMQAQGLSTIYHSKLSPPELQYQLHQYISKELTTVTEEKGAPGEPCVCPPMDSMDFMVFEQTTKQHGETICTVGNFKMWN